MRRSALNLTWRIKPDRFLVHFWSSFSFQLRLMCFPFHVFYTWPHPDPNYRANWGDNLLAPLFGCLEATILLINARAEFPISMWYLIQYVYCVIFGPRTLWFCVRVIKSMLELVWPIMRIQSMRRENIKMKLRLVCCSNVAVELDWNECRMYPSCTARSLLFRWKIALASQLARTT